MTASWISLDRIEVCKVTDKTIETSTCTCLFSTSQDIAASETGQAKDGSWIWGLQPSTTASWINLDRMEVCKVTDNPIDTATSACLFSTSLDSTASETRDAKDGSWIRKVQRSIAAK